MTPPDQTPKPVTCACHRHLDGEIFIQKSAFEALQAENERLLNTLKKIDVELKKIGSGSYNEHGYEIAERMRESLVRKALERK